MADDDPLYRPLGLTPERAGPSTSRRPWRVAAVIVSLVVLGGLSAVVWQQRSREDPSVAVASIDVAPPPVSAPPSQPDVVATVAPPLPAPSGTTVEMQNGVKIIRFNGSSSSASVTIPVGTDTALTPAPDSRISEKTAEGLLPRLGATGARASTIYARRTPAGAGPRIALLLAGLGPDQLATAEAARRLPADVSFGFAPDTADGGAQVAEARRLGHEVFLDLRTPAASSSDGGGARDLRRRLGRWPGYVGLLLGADAAASAAAQEATGRGLLSIAPDPSPVGVNRVADLAVDAGEGAVALTADIARLVAIARAKGTALGVIEHAVPQGTALSAVLDGLAAQNVVLVPASAVATVKAGSADASR